ncbi:hypothetical protein AB0F88_17020 [Streptosporangium sp. NPDC023963]|uniref:hypothetical protein n=1 Tax=Streptosporangium sp. NPDC023963 TaxID=3155608 RepID=UPI00343ED5CE
MDTEPRSLAEQQQALVAQLREAGYDAEPTPPGETAADAILRAVENGDVAAIITRRDIDT